MHSLSLPVSSRTDLSGVDDRHKGLPIVLQRAAALWMRELGLEWIWRLMQEPKVKFVRYVLGTPLFLIRVYLLKQHIRGV